MKSFVIRTSLPKFVMQIYINRVLNKLFTNNLTVIFMNKTDLVAKIAEGAGMSKVDAKKALEATLDAITAAVKKDEKVALVGFGTFSVTKRDARKGINPATKKAITIPAKKVVKFKAGSELTF